jgi:hypothetical protein
MTLKVAAFWAAFSINILAQQYPSSLTPQQAQTAENLRRLGEGMATAISNAVEEGRQRKIKMQEDQWRWQEKQEQMARERAEMEREERQRQQEWNAQMATRLPAQQDPTPPPVTSPGWYYTLTNNIGRVELLNRGPFKSRAEAENLAARDRNEGLSVGPCFGVSIPELPSDSSTVSATQTTPASPSSREWAWYYNITNNIGRTEILQRGPFKSHAEAERQAKNDLQEGINAGPCFATPLH